MRGIQKPTPVHVFHISRLALFSVLMVALLVVRAASSHSLGLTYNKHVLAYATAMNQTDLLSAANASRAANGLSPLTLNVQLNHSAQMKAEDMIAKNYWAHVSPDGTQPWYWFTLAGYNYLAAGENLAYGFDNGTDVNAAWMNSPSHKANVLGDYVDVGFGIASGAAYQGGENTVVVAHYGKPQPAAPAPQPAPAPTAPTATTTTTPKTTTSTPKQTTPTPTTTPAATPTSPEPVATEPTTQETIQPQTTANASGGTLATAPTDTNVSILDELKQGKLSTVAAVSLGAFSVATTGFALTHRAFLRHLIRNGEKFVLHHPLFDGLVLAGILGLILTTTVGHLL